MEQVMKAAQALGDEIKKSEIYTNMMLANAELEADEAAQNALAAFRAHRLVVQALENAEEGAIPQSEAEEARDKLMRMQIELAGMATIDRAQQAGDAFEDLMNKVNGVLQKILIGEEAGGGCTGSCSTCGGCH